MRAIAALLVSSLLTSCTATKTRAPIETKTVSIDWAHVPAQTLDVGGATLQGLLLTPSQWPLEESMRRIFHGDLEGFITELSLTFRPSMIPDGVLQDLYDAGFIPAYVRLSNNSGQAVNFDPARVVVDVGNGVLLLPARPEELQARFTKFSGEKTGEAIGFALLVVVLVLLIVAASKNGGGHFDPSIGPGHGQESSNRPDTPTSKPNEPIISDDGLLRPMSISPNAYIEGVLLFHKPTESVNWNAAKLLAR